jgi:hypothetical protein
MIFLANKSTYHEDGKNGGNRRMKTILKKGKSSNTFFRWSWRVLYNATHAFCRNGVSDRFGDGVRPSISQAFISLALALEILPFRVNMAESTILFFPSVSSVTVG